MPIRSFEIRNVGPIKYAKADNLPSIIIIAGPNGVGKSTLLETLKKRRGNINATGKFLYIPPHRTPAPFSLHKLLPVVGPRKRFIDILAQDNFSISVPGISLPYYFTASTQRSRTTPDFAPYFEVKYKLAQFQYEFGRTLIEVFERFEGKVPEGVMPKDIYKPFRELVKTLLPGISFNHVSLEGDVYKVYFKSRSGVLVEFDQLSSGEKDLIAILFPFVEKKIENELARAKGIEIPYEDLVILLDTPESYLHPALQSRLLDYIRNSIEEAEARGEKLQFLLVTHSTSIISKAEPGELFALFFPGQLQDENQLIRISTEKEKIELIRDVLGDQGLIALVTGKPLLLLEGQNDIEIVKLLKPDIEEKFALVPLRGKGRIRNFTTLFKALIDWLKPRGFKIIAILDKDSEILEEKEENCLTWPVACIENLLLLNNKAIFEALKIMVGEEKLREKGIDCDKAITTLFDEIFQDPIILNEEIRARITRQLWFGFKEDWQTIEELEQKIRALIGKKIDRIKQQYEKLSSELKQIIEDKEKRLREINGKIVLGRLANIFNVNKDILARNIADKLRILGQIPLEFEEIMAQVEKLTL